MTCFFSDWGLGVQGSGWRVQGCGAAHKIMKAPRMFDWRFARIVIPSVAEESFPFAVKQDS